MYSNNVLWWAACEGWDGSPGPEIMQFHAPYTARQLITPALYPVKHRQPFNNTFSNGAMNTTWTQESQIHHIDRPQPVNPDYFPNHKWPIGGPRKVQTDREDPSQNPLRHPEHSDHPRGRYIAPTLGVRRPDESVQGAGAATSAPAGGCPVAALSETPVSNSVWLRPSSAKSQSQQEPWGCGRVAGWSTRLQPLKRCDPFGGKWRLSVNISLWSRQYNKNIWTCHIGLSIYIEQCKWTNLVLTEGKLEILAPDIKFSESSPLSHCYFGRYLNTPAGKKHNLKVNTRKTQWII